MPWATPEDVLNVTRATVTDGEIMSAQFLVEIFAETTEEATEVGNVSSRNLRLLSLAVCYQATWMQAHPDIFTNVDLANLSQDGVSGQMAHANARLLAPLAKRCLDRLTWINEPLRVRLPGEYIPDRSNRDSAAHDDSRAWTPFGTGGGR